MASYDLNGVKTGLKILVDNDPYVITDAEFVKPGKGQAFTRIKIRNLVNGRTTEKTLKSSDKVDGAEVVDADMTFSYKDGDQWVFSDQDYNEHRANEAGVGDASKWLMGTEECVVTSWTKADGSTQIIAVQAPNFVELKIVETDPGVRGDTSGGGGKPAKLESGAVVRVPLFVGQDEVIKVDTRSGEYVSRVK
ncbi:MAG TPA: elongation factor P [Dyella sp.]|jgi:elongation factor P|uniref:elongation factor P n=1 Tax=Dyella sp. TaxID=1869338 RepID=UPI002F94FCA0